MAENQELSSLKKKDSSDLPALRNVEIGYNGLSVVSGQVLEEIDPELRFPRSMWTFKRMLHDGTIAPAVDIFSTTISSVKWFVKAPVGYEKELEQETAFIESIKGDMKHSWLSFLKLAVSFIPFGFSAFEIVPQYRLKSSGSRYNDGYIGIKKLAFRSQDTVSGWEYTNKGRDLSGMWQRVNIPIGKGLAREINSNLLSYNSDGGKTEQLIPISKLLLFRNNAIKDSPVGVSNLVGAYKSWKFKIAYEENQAHGVAQDVHGLKVLYMPQDYLVEDARAEDKAVFEEYKNIMRNIHVGQESGIILPMVRDELNGQKAFEFEIVNTTGQKAHDVRKIIEDYRKEILTALYADFLITGQNGGGSFALAESKNDWVKIVLESKLEEIRDVLNHQLIPKIFKWNNWETEVYPTFEFEPVAKVTLTEFSKAWQLLSATGGIAKTIKNVNIAHEMMGLVPIPEDTKLEDFYEMLVNRSGSKSSEGLSSDTGGLNGTSNSVSSDNRSVSNKDNK